MSLKDWKWSANKYDSDYPLDYDSMLANLSHQFIDLCILLGCDYLDPIKGVGPSTALKLIREHKTLEGVVEHMKSNSKYTIPDGALYV